MRPGRDGPRDMRFFFTALLVVLLGAAAVYSYVAAADARRAATVARSRAVALRRHLAAATSELDRAAAELEAAAARVRAASTGKRQALAELGRVQEEWDRARKRVRSLETELRTAVARRADLDSLIERTAKELREERERHNKEIWAARKFMPEGVRQAVLAANECMHADGHGGMQILKARAVEDRALRGVQFLERDSVSLGATIYIADSVTLDLDRFKGVLTLSFAAGYSRGPRGREEFPPTGRRLVLAGVDGRRWEDRLPYLVNAHGEYAADRAQVRRPRLPFARRRAWQKRINALLASAKTDPTYRVDAFRNLDDGEFVEVLLVGVGESKTLQMTAEAERLRVQVNDRTKTVELWLQGGVLRRKGGESKIPSAGYRIRLPGIEPARARKEMLGMVERQ